MMSILTPDYFTEPTGWEVAMDDRNVMDDWITRNVYSPYLTLEDELELLPQTDCTRVQLYNYIANRRTNKNSLWNKLIEELKIDRRSIIKQNKQFKELFDKACK